MLFILDNKFEKQEEVRVKDDQPPSNKKTISEIEQQDSTERDHTPVPSDLVLDLFTSEPKKRTDIKLPIVTISKEIEAESSDGNSTPVGKFEVKGGHFVYDEKPASSVDSIETKPVPAKEPETVTIEVEGDIVESMNVEEDEETLDDGTRLKHKIITKKQVKPITETAMKGGKAVGSKTREEVIGTDIEEDILELAPDVSVAFGSNLENETTVEEFDETMPDGTWVKRKVTRVKVTRKKSAPVKPPWMTKESERLTMKETDAEVVPLPSHLEGTTTVEKVTELPERSQDNIEKLISDSVAAASQAQEGELSGDVKVDRQRKTGADDFRTSLDRNETQIEVLPAKSDDVWKEIVSTKPCDVEKTMIIPELPVKTEDIVSTKPDEAGKTVVIPEQPEKTEDIVSTKSDEAGKTVVIPEHPVKTQDIVSTKPDEAGETVVIPEPPVKTEDIVSTKPDEAGKTVVIPEQPVKTERNLKHPT